MANVLAGTNNVTKTDFFASSFKDFAKLRINLHKHLLYVRYSNDLLQLFKTLAQMQVKVFVLQQSFWLLSEYFIRDKSRNPAIRVM